MTRSTSITGITRRATLAAGLGLGLGIPPLRAATADGTIRIGILTDLSSVYHDLNAGGPPCARLAIKEFTDANPDMPVEVSVADHQNKPDLAVTIVRGWFDRGIDVALELGSSATTLAVSTVGQERDKVMLATSAANTELTGQYCSPNLIHWAFDQWCIAHSNAAQLVKTNGKTWFFVGSDNLAGHTSHSETARFVEAAGGKVIGAVFYPFDVTSDFSSYLLQAANSGAEVLCLANSGTELANSMKQAQEFGLNQKMRLASTNAYDTDVVGMGLPVAQGLILTETFYWDLNDRTRAFSKRVAPLLAPGAIPNMNNAGDYSALTHYFKAVKAMGVAKAKASGRAVVETMKQMPTDDDCFGPGTIRADGRKLHPAYLFEVKRPGDSTGRNDVLKLLASTPADQAFRPMAEGKCGFVKS